MASKTSKSNNPWEQLLAEWREIGTVKTSGPVPLETLRAAEKRYGVTFPPEYVDLMIHVGEVTLDTGAERITVFGPKSMPPAAQGLQERLDLIAEGATDSAPHAARKSVPVIGYRDTFPNGAFLVGKDGKVREASGKLLELGKPVNFTKALIKEVGTLEPAAKSSGDDPKALAALHAAICAAFPKHLPNKLAPDATVINIVLQKTPSLRIMFSGDLSLCRLECAFNKVVQTPGKASRFAKVLASSDFELRSGVTFALVRKFPNPTAPNAAEVVSAVKEAKALAKAYG